MGLSYGGTEKGQELKKEQKGPERAPTCFSCWHQQVSGSCFRKRWSSQIGTGVPGLQASWEMQNGLEGPSCPGTSLPSVLGSCQRKRQSEASLRPGGCLDWSLVSSWGPIL